jgi:hypothetical protein
MTGRRIGELLSSPLVLVGAIGFLLEEVLWSGFGRLMEKIGRWPPVTRLESAILRLPPYAALALFVVPLAIVWPIKVGALWLIAVGRVKCGLLVLVGGETIGAAITARLYALCRPALAHLLWFVRIETAVLRCSAWAHEHMARQPWWQKMKRLARRFADRLRVARRRGGAYARR